MGVRFYTFFCVFSLSFFCTLCSHNSSSGEQDHKNHRSKSFSGRTGKSTQPCDTEVLLINGTPDQIYVSDRIQGFERCKECILKPFEQKKLCSLGGYIFLKNIAAEKKNELFLKNVFGEDYLPILKKAIKDDPTLIPVINTICDLDVFKYYLNKMKTDLSLNSSKKDSENRKREAYYSILKQQAKLNRKVKRTTEGALRVPGIIEKSVSSGIYALVYNSETGEYLLTQKLGKIT